MDLSTETRTALRRGEALYRQGRYFDAHEAWEEVWRVEHGEVRALLGGLIQVAAALHHALVRHRAIGAARLFAAAQERLAPLGPRADGLDLERLRDEVRRALGAARRWERGEAEGFPAELAPRL
ncbi:MAG TPA: DUF309 domain-containing protein [Anaeromyxobacteraceae bacterium]|nr:DUF309 domain-containing protein [Anaeromyxobacteraceae bacterium]